MATTLGQFLYGSDVFGNPTELINGARTAHRLLRSENWGRGEFSDVLDNAGCDGLLLQPCTMADDGTTEDWLMMDLRPEASPWYTGSAASLEAFGFYIEEWTGMDGAHHGRSVTPLGRGGANYGPQSHGARVMKLNVLLMGSSERGLTHLFRWLESTLLNCCNPCHDASIWVREFCPTEPSIDPEEGLARLARVALVEGPTWETPVSDRSGCTVRRASFTLSAGDPCMYGSEVSCLPATTDFMTGDVDYDVLPDLVGVSSGWGWSCTPSFDGVDYGVLAPKVTITSEFDTFGSLRQALPDLRISAYANPGGVAAAPFTLRKIGELIITGRGTTGLEIVADLAERTVKYRENTGNSPPEWVDGSRLIGQQVEANVRRWFSVQACDYPLIAVEPVYGDLRNTTEGVTTTEQTITVTIDMIRKWSCC